MAQIIEMPKLSDTMTVGTLVSWLKKTGDKVAAGDKVAEIETDKATMELESFDDGVILTQYLKAGEQVAVGAPIYALGKAGEAAPAAPSAKAPAAVEAAPTTPAPAAPVAAPAPTPAPVAAAPAPAPAAPAASIDGRVKASPLARKVAAASGVSLEGVAGTGPGGRIIKADVEAAKASPKPAPAAAAAPAKTQEGKPAKAEVPFVGLEAKQVPVSTMRGVIAKRLLESKTTIPHFYLELEVDAAPLSDLRASLNAALADLPPAAGGIKLSVNDLILKASAEALRRVPAMNASWQGSQIAWHGAVHLAFGVALEDGLVTPVIRDAHAKSLRQISLEAKDLASRARSKKLKPDEMTGSTFTVTNLGMYGITGFFGIINPPNAAILSVGATVKKPVVNAKDEIVVGQRMVLGLSGDHRVVDGAVAAQFLAALRDLIEKPASMLV